MRLLGDCFLLVAAVGGLQLGSSVTVLVTAAGVFLAFSCGDSLGAAVHRTLFFAAAQLTNIITSSGGFGIVHVLGFLAICAGRTLVVFPVAALNTAVELTVVLLGTAGAGLLPTVTAPRHHEKRGEVEKGKKERRGAEHLSQFLLDCSVMQRGDFLQVVEDFEPLLCDCHKPELCFWCHSD